MPPDEVGTRYFKVTLEYDGTDFHGFQFQGGCRTIQEEVERCILTLTGCSVRVDGAGRTDTGVHALGQVITFGAVTRIPLERMCRAFNSVLPRDIAAVHCSEVNGKFHARFSAVARRYMYVLLQRPQRSPVWDRFTHRVEVPLDVPAMKVGAQSLCGTHDFAAWANSLDGCTNTVRTVNCCSVRRVGAFVLIVIEANGFLRAMVRNITGTLLQVGSGACDVARVEQITRLRNRQEAGPTAPPNGLFLTRGRYPAHEIGTEVRE